MSVDEGQVKKPDQIKQPDIGYSDWGYADATNTPISLLQWTQEVTQSINWLLAQQKTDAEKLGDFIMKVQEIQLAREADND